MKQMLWEAQCWTQTLCSKSLYSRDTKHGQTDIRVQFRLNDQGGASGKRKTAGAKVENRAPRSSGPQSQLYLRIPKSPRMITNRTAMLSYSHWIGLALGPDFFLINTLFLKNTCMFIEILMGKHREFLYTISTHTHTHTHSFPHYLQLALVWRICYNWWANINTFGESKSIAFIGFTPCGMHSIGFDKVENYLFLLCI